MILASLYWTLQSLFSGEKRFFQRGLDCERLLLFFLFSGFYITDGFALSLQALKRDIINTLNDRCEILFEDLIINEGPHKKSRN